jgi:hypothetical protein
MRKKSNKGEEKVAKEKAKNRKREFKISNQKAP